MSGVAIIRYLLAHDATVLASVPATRIMAGVLPQGTLPALAVSQVSVVPLLDVRAATQLRTERVQVTAVVKGQDSEPLGGGYPAVKALLRKVVAACPNQRTTINGAIVDSISLDLEGPDQVDLDADLFSLNVDFIVRWHYAA